MTKNNEKREVILPEWGHIPLAFQEKIRLDRAMKNVLSSQVVDLKAYRQLSIDQSLCRYSCEQTINRNKPNSG